MAKKYRVVKKIQAGGDAVFFIEYKGWFFWHAEMDYRDCELEASSVEDGHKKIYNLIQEDRELVRRQKSKEKAIAKNLKDRKVVGKEKHEFNEVMYKLKQK